VNFNLILAYAATLLCGGLGVFLFFKEKRSFVNLTFTAGMLALAAEAALNGLSFRESLPLDIADWQLLRLIVSAFVPVCWLLFSLSFGRGDYRVIIKKWQWYILAFLLVPLGLTGFFSESIFNTIPAQEADLNWAISLGWAGYVIYLLFLLESALIIRALERTLRTSTGNIRWQIKFMILGVGGIFAVRIYTGSQVLLFHSLEAQLQIINIGTLIMGTALVIFSLFRLRLLKIEIYPSASLIRGSITVVIVGIYLIAVGVLARVADYFEISQSFLFQALLVFLACLGLALILLSKRLRQEIKGFITVHLKRQKYDYHLTTKEFAMQLKALLKPDGLLLANVIDSFKVGQFMPSYILTLEEVFGKGNVHLITFTWDYANRGILTYVVVAGAKALDMDHFIKTIERKGAKEMVSHVMPQERLQQYLHERYAIVLSDDYVPVDNLIAPTFEKRFRYQSKKKR